MKKVAFASYNGLVEKQSDDMLAIQDLIQKEKLNMQVECVSWDNQDANWYDYDLIMIDSTWDYHLKPNLFRSWLDILSETGIKVINPPELVKWNMEKSYLIQLQKSGFKIPTTIFIRKNTQIQEAVNLVEKAFYGIRTNFLITKPLISASSYHTYKIEYPFNQHGKAIIQEQITKHDVIIQEYIPDIKSGEYSIIFIDGQYTESFLKIPEKGEFRSQSEFGGTVTKQIPPLRFIDRADRVLDALPVYPVYARIDIIDDGVSGILMECELIEPYLFLKQSPKTSQALLNAIRNRL